MDRQKILLNCLILLTFLSAISVVYVTNYQRQLFVSLQKLMQQRDDMNIEWRKLLLEENTISTSSQVEVKANKELNMKVPSAKDIIFIKLD